MIGQMRRRLEDPIAISAGMTGGLVRTSDMISDVEAVFELPSANCAQVLGRIELRVLDNVVVVFVVYRVPFAFGLWRGLDCPFLCPGIRLHLLGDRFRDCREPREVSCVERLMDGGEVVDGGLTVIFESVLDDSKVLCTDLFTSKDYVRVFLLHVRNVVHAMQVLQTVQLEIRVAQPKVRFSEPAADTGQAL